MEVLVFHSPSSYSSLFTLSFVLSVIEEGEEEAVRVDDAVGGRCSCLVLLEAEGEAAAQAAALEDSVVAVPAVEAEQAEAGNI